MTVEVTILRECDLNAWWLAQKSQTSFFNQWETQSKEITPHTRDFSRALNNFLEILIGSLPCLRSLWLDGVITLVMVFRQSFENQYRVLPLLNNPVPLQIGINALKACVPPASEITVEVIIRSFTYNNNNNNYDYKVQRTSCPGPCSSKLDYANPRFV